jgi:hypothetical protein
MPKTSASHPPYIYLATLFWAVPISRFVLYCILHFTLPTRSIGHRAGGFGARRRRASPVCVFRKKNDPQRHGMTLDLHSVLELRAPWVRPRACLNSVPVHTPPCVNTQRFCVSTVSNDCPKHCVFIYYAVLQHRVQFYNSKITISTNIW